MDAADLKLFEAVARLGGTFMGITALGFAAARALAPEDQRRAFALTTAGFGLGQIVGPVVGGLLLDRTGGFAAPSLLAAGALLVAALLAATSSAGPGGQLNLGTEVVPG